jgi:YjbE family integral membrane protein
MLLQWIGVAVAIVVVDLALSGDNALVIGAVASRLAPRERRLAIFFGGAMAIVLRILLAEAAVFALQIQYLQTLGGLIVFAIALQMVAEQISAQGDGNGRRPRRALSGGEHLLRASLTILIADVSMSLDNVLAVAALASGNYVVLIVGLLLSVAILMVASSLVAKLLERFPVLLYAAGIILAWTAGAMVLNDKAVHPFIVAVDNQVPGPPLVWFVPPLFVLALLVCAALLWLVHLLRGRARRGTA